MSKGIYSLQKTRSSICKYSEATHPVILPENLMWTEEPAGQQLWGPKESDRTHDFTFTFFLEFHKWLNPRFSYFLFHILGLFNYLSLGS